MEIRDYTKSSWSIWLGDQLPDCPQGWQNFIEGLCTNYTGNLPRTVIFNELKKFDATVDFTTNYLTFNDENKYILFVLTHGDIS